MNAQLARGVVHCSNNQMRRTMYVFRATTATGTCDGVVRANSVDDALSELRQYFEGVREVKVSLTCTSTYSEIVL